MTIDQISKLVDIVFKGVAATVIAAAGLYLTKEKNSQDAIRQCDAVYSTLVDYASKTVFDERIRAHLSFRISNYNRMCQPALNEDQIQGIMNMLILTAQQPSPPDGPLSGWVALSRIPSKQYSDVNFDNASGRAGFSVNDTIKSRWTVNVRQKNTPVSRGDNPVLGVLDAGSCSRIEERATGQLNEWARISQVPCT